MGRTFMGSHVTCIKAQWHVHGSSWAFIRLHGIPMATQSRNVVGLDNTYVVVCGLIHVVHEKSASMTD